jgi:hypothetical protein
MVEPGAKSSGRNGVKGARFHETSVSAPSLEEAELVLEGAPRGEAREEAELVREGIWKEVRKTYTK